MKIVRIRPPLSTITSVIVLNVIVFLHSCINRILLTPLTLGVPYGLDHFLSNYRGLILNSIVTHKYGIVLTRVGISKSKWTMLYGWSFEHHVKLNQITK